MKDFKKIGDCIGNKIENKMKIQVYAPRETFNRLKLIAIEKRTSVGEMIRTMIDDYLNNYDGSNNEDIA